VKFASRPLHLAFILLFLVASVAHGLGAGESLGRTLSTQQRMEEKHLKAATEDAERHNAARQPVALQTGLTDYRAILHAHANDSTHTGGTLPEILADAQKVGVSIIMLSNHFRPPFDFIDDNWRGMREGVLFIPGSEAKGFLIYPMHSVMDKMELEGIAFVNAITEGGGLIFLSHVESKFGHSFEGLTGMEAYNRHADAMDDMFAVASLLMALVDPPKLAKQQELLDQYPAAMLATQLDYLDAYAGMWDRESLRQRVVGIAANDCHHNMVLIAKMVDEENVLVGTIVDKDEGLRKVNAAQSPGIRELTAGKKPGDIVAKLDLDPYYRSFMNVSTHILATELTETAVRDALREGHAYISHDWMCDPTGTVYAARHADAEKLVAIMGDEVKYDSELRLVAEFPVDCDVRLLKNGEEVIRTHGRTFTHSPDGPGVYRLEAFLKVDGEDRPWIYANPIYVR